MSDLISKRSNIKPFLAIDMLTQANKLKSSGKDIVHMELIDVVLIANVII